MTSSNLPDDLQQALIKTTAVLAEWDLAVTHYDPGQAPGSFDGLRAALHAAEAALGRVEGELLLASGQEVCHHRKVLDRAGGFLRAASDPTDRRLVDAAAERWGRLLVRWGVPGNGERPDPRDAEREAFLTCPMKTPDLVRRWLAGERVSIDAHVRGAVPVTRPPASVLFLNAEDDATDTIRGTQRARGSRGARSNG